MNDYEKIEKVIKYLIENFREQPDLDKLSEIACMSPFHFQRMFSEWAGVSPKKFLQFISIEHAKRLLKDQNTISEASYNSGLSGTSRLHDLFVNIEGMTPGEFKNGGRSLGISWENYGSPFGEMTLAATSKGICFMVFTASGDSGFDNLKEKFPEATFRKEPHEFHHSALSVFNNKNGDLSKIKLHLKGTEFQLNVWQALLKIPAGNLSSYSGIAKSIGSPLAARAVGTAIGDNPVAYLIPCHRVIQSTGIIGEYRWGSIRKTAMIGRESSEIYREH
jgi:AraC family transcriptional regulator of adaptative response/methylated-DNA-[protein]-cysteine methyltransferase